MEDPKPTNNKIWSCKQKSDCPLHQNFLPECLVYNAVVNTSKRKNYYGTCEKSFKERYSNHTSSFRNKSCQKSTELSIGIERKWCELHNQLVNCYESISKHLWNEKMWFMFCDKLLIARANSASLLNKHNEMLWTVWWLGNPMKLSVMVYCCC